MSGQFKKYVERATRVEALWALWNLIKEAFGSPLSWIIGALLAVWGGAMAMLSSLNAFVSSQGPFGYAVVFSLSVFVGLAIVALVLNIRRSRTDPYASFDDVDGDEMEAGLSNLRMAFHALDNEIKRLWSRADITEKAVFKSATLLTGPSLEDSRIVKLEAALASVQAEIKSLGQRIEGNHREAKLLTRMISDSIRARDGRDILYASDKLIKSLAPKLLEARKNDYASDSEWRADYDRWDAAVSEIDRIAGLWLDNYKSYMDLGKRDYERGAPLPPDNGNVTAQENGIRYQTVYIVQVDYANKNEQLIQYIDSKCYQLP